MRGCKYVGIKIGMQPAGRHERRAFFQKAKGPAEYKSIRAVGVQNVKATSARTMACMGKVRKLGIACCRKAWAYRIRKGEGV